jgi:hypothetical protein
MNYQDEIALLKVGNPIDPALATPPMPASLKR